MTSTIECSDYSARICIKEKRQYNHCHQVGKQMHVIFESLTQRAYIDNGEKSCFILKQIHWAETRDVILRSSDAILIFW